MAKSTFLPQYSRSSRDRLRPADWFVWEADSDDDRYKQPRNDNPMRSSFFHDSIHDVESLLWILVYLALTRVGPGVNAVREEVDEPTSSLSQVVKELFYADDPVEFKGKLLEFPDQMESAIFPLFHPYFDPLKPVISTIWRKLILGYWCRAYEYHGILKYTIAALNRTLGDFEKNPPHRGDERSQYEELTRKEVDRRKGYIERRLAQFRPSPTESSTSLLEGDSAQQGGPLAGVVAPEKRPADTDRWEGPSSQPSKRLAGQAVAPTERPADTDWEAGPSRSPAKRRRKKGKK